MELHYKLWRSTLCRAGYFRISVYLFNGSLFWSNNIFLNDLCHYMLFSINKFAANIYTFITHGLAQASHIYTLLTYGLPPRFYFFNLVPILCTSIIPIPEPYFFPYTVLNTNITFETNLSILSNAITKFIPTNHHARKTSTTPVKFLHVKFTVKFTQATQISGFYFSIKKITMDV